APVSAFIVPHFTTPQWNQTAVDGTLLTTGPGATVELTNDVRSAEWVIKRHAADVTPAVMRNNLAQDIDRMFRMRTGLANLVTRLRPTNPSQVIALTPGDVANVNLVGAPGLFVYTPGTSKGKAQITVQYSRQETIERINLLNVSKYVSGTKVREGEDVSR